jgi:hypothetical protein
MGGRKTAAKLAVHSSPLVYIRVERYAWPYAGR